MKTIKPDNKQELIILIEKHMRCYGHICDLNNIDISAIDDLSLLFFEHRYLNQFNGDISTWNVEKVQWMDFMFSYSMFNHSLDLWNPQQLDSLNDMFDHAICSTPYWFIDNKFERSLLLNRQACKK